MEPVPTEEVSISVEEEQKPIEDPRWLGNCMAFCYRGHNPKIIIGPHCMLSISG